MTVWEDLPAQFNVATYFVDPRIWVRGRDGSIKAGTLAPGAGADRVTPLGVPDQSTSHYEGWLSLRCIKRG